MELPKRKTIRLPDYDYDTPGYYFITICTKEKKCILCRIVGTGLLDGPQRSLTSYGRIVEQQIQRMCSFYRDVTVDQYVIMPNHVHIILRIEDSGDGPSGRPVPTNTKLSRFVGTFKRFCNRQCGGNIWQCRSHDHVIRGEADYRKIWQYIAENPARWAEDCFYTEE